MSTVTIIGGGIAGLCAAIAAAEEGADVDLHERQERLGGRAGTIPGPFHANFGPHVLYDDGPFWAWLQTRGLAEPAARAPLAGPVRFLYEGRTRRLPPRALFAVTRLLRREAPADSSFRAWASSVIGAHPAALLCSAAGVVTFDHDPGRLSAAFVWDRLRRALAVPPVARYVPGGWQTLVERLALHAVHLGVRIHTASRIDTPPRPPLVVAIELRAARALLQDDSLRWQGARTVVVDIVVRSGRKRSDDPFVVVFLDRPGWAETFTRADTSLAPRGHHLVQLQAGLRPDEGLRDGVAYLESVLDRAYCGWRDRCVWQRRGVLEGRSGAVDLPGTTWRDRPAVERGEGVFLAGDMVAAPGLLGEVAWASGLRAGSAAARYAAEHAAAQRTRRRAS
jgi:phytoene dehydrogenase-like protein